MNLFAESFVRWLADYYLLVTMLLVVTLGVSWLIAQPARRVAVTRATLVGLALLAALCALQGWSVVHLMTLEAEVVATAIAQVPVTTEVIAVETSPVVAPVDPAPLPPKPEVASLPTKTASETPTVAQVSAVEIVGLAFLVGTLFVIAWQLIGHWRARVLVQGAKEAPSELQRMLIELSGAASHFPPSSGEGLGEGENQRKAPRLLISPALPTAVALGIFRPTILLPQKLVETSDISALRTILTHELAHIRHGDLRLLALCRALFVLLWANPLFWLLRRRLRLDQETLADAAAAEVSTRHQYAEQLVDWAKRFATDRPPALAAAVGLWESPSQLRRRIAVLLDERLTIWRECSRRWRLASLVVCAGVAVGLSLVTLEPGAPKVVSAAESSIRADDPSGSPENPPLFLGIRVVNESGTPIVGAVVKPFALTNEKNGAHAGWFYARDGRGKPQEHTTDSFGMATVRYPTFVRERIRTQFVSVEVAHSDYVLDTAELAVTDEAALVQLKRAGNVEIAARLPGQSKILDNVYGMGDKFQAYRTKWTRLKNGSIRSPGLSTERKVGVRAVWIPVDGPVHFSKIAQVELKAGETQQLKLEVLPGSRLEGNLASNIPRPVTNGKVIAEIDSSGETGWYEWTTIQGDGTFKFESLPRDKGEVVQLFAICDGFVSKPPTAIEEGQYRGRPQTIALGDEVLRHTMEMIPTAKCIVTLRDSDGDPIPDACVRFSPNIVTSSGSSTFAHPLRRSTDLLRGLATWQWSYEEAMKDYPHQAISDNNGIARLPNLPPFHPFTFHVDHDEFQLPIRKVNGRKVRSAEAELEPGRLTQVELLMQLKGKDVLSEDVSSYRNVIEVFGDYFILCPVTTDLQRSLLGNVTEPASQASLCVFVNGMAFRDDQIDAGSPEFVELANRLEAIAKADNRQVIFRVIVFQTDEFDGEKLRERAETLLKLCELLGHGAGFKRSKWVQNFQTSDFDWAAVAEKARRAAEQSESDVEEAVGNDRVQVYPVRTYLSHLLVNADCVVNIFPVLRQKEGNRFPDDFLTEMNKFVPQLEYDPPQTMLIRVMYAEAAKSHLEAWVNFREAGEALAEEFGFVNCRLSQSFTNEPEKAPKPASEPANPQIRRSGV